MDHLLVAQLLAPHPHGARADQNDLYPVAQEILDLLTEGAEAAQGEAPIRPGDDRSADLTETRVGNGFESRDWLILTTFERGLPVLHLERFWMYAPGRRLQGRPDRNMGGEWVESREWLMLT